MQREDESRKTFRTGFAPTNLLMHTQCHYRYTLLSYYDDGVIKYVGERYRQGGTLAKIVYIDTFYTIHLYRSIYV